MTTRTKQGFNAEDYHDQTNIIHGGDSGSAGTGILIEGPYDAGGYEFADGQYARIVRVDAAGTLGFITTDGNTHVVEMDAKTELRGYEVTAILNASTTTCTGIHLFW